MGCCCVVQSSIFVCGSDGAEGVGGFPNIYPLMLITCGSRDRESGLYDMSVLSLIRASSKFDPVVFLNHKRKKTLCSKCADLRTSV